MPNQIPSHSNKISFFTKILNNFLYSSNYPLKSWIFNSHFPYKVKQLNPQLSFKLQYKVCWVLHKMTSSFSPPFLFLQAPLHSPPTIPSSTSAIFPSIPFPTCLQNHPYNPHQHSLNLYTSAIFRLLVLHKAIPTNPMKNLFPYLCHSVNSNCEKGWHSFNLSLFPWSTTEIEALTNTDS